MVGSYQQLHVLVIIGLYIPK